MAQPTDLLLRRGERILERGSVCQTRNCGERRQVSVWRWSCATRRDSWWNWTASCRAAVCLNLLFCPDYCDIKASGRVWRKQQVVIVTVKQEQIVTGQGMVCLGAARPVVPPLHILYHFQEGWNSRLLCGLKIIGTNEALFFLQP